MKLNEMVKRGRTFDTVDYGTVLAQPQRNAKGRSTGRINLVTMNGDVPAVFDASLAATIDIALISEPTNLEKVTTEAIRLTTIYRDQYVYVYQTSATEFGIRFTPIAPESGEPGVLVALYRNGESVASPAY